MVCDVQVFSPTEDARFQHDVRALDAEESLGAQQVVLGGVHQGAAVVDVAIGGEHGLEVVDAAQPGEQGRDGIPGVAGVELPAKVGAKQAAKRQIQGLRPLPGREDDLDEGHGSGGDAGILEQAQGDVEEGGVVGQTILGQVAFHVVEDGVDASGQSAALPTRVLQHMARRGAVLPP